MPRKLENRPLTERELRAMFDALDRAEAAKQERELERERREQEHDGKAV